MKKLFGKGRLKFAESGIITEKYQAGYCKINYVTMQLLAHAISEYLFDKYDRNDLANQGIVVGFDSRYESFGMAHLMAAVFKAYQIRVYCLDRYSIAPFLAYFTKKVKCLMGVFVTGRDYSKEYSGVMVFDGKGELIDRETCDVIEKYHRDYILS